MIDGIIPKEPLETEIMNPNRDDYWTCPACYQDLGSVGRGRHTCPDCGREIECWIERHPACHSRLVEAQAQED